MPIYMDIHEVPGIEAIDAAEAHRKDMLIQKEYRCKCMTYWIDVERGVAFCLIEGPDKSVVEEMHRKSHGLIPNKIIEVKQELVQSFLGRIHDPEDATISDTGLKVFSESALRILLVTAMTDPVLLRCSLGAEQAGDLLNRVRDIVGNALSAHGGRETEHAGAGSVASFSSAARALSCAVEIRRNLSGGDRALIDFKLAVNAGEPVAESDLLFGDAIQLARQLCTIGTDSGIVVANRVKDLLPTDRLERGHFLVLPPQDESLVKSAFALLESNWQDTVFDVVAFGRALALSTSGLYRKTMALWGLPPNRLLKEYRLNKARELLKRQSGNIAQTTFESGFSSPSYFTKCFKERYGLLPAKYLAALS